MNLPELSNRIEALYISINLMHEHDYSYTAFCSIFHPHRASAILRFFSSQYCGIPHE